MEHLSHTLNSSFQNIVKLNPRSQSQSHGDAGIGVLNHITADDEGSFYTWDSASLSLIITDHCGISISFRCDPAPEFEVERISVNSDGVKIVLYGISELMVGQIDKKAVRLHLAQASQAHAESKNENIMNIENPPLYLHAVDSSIWPSKSRVGISVIAVEWHHISCEHLLVLTSDGNLSMYCIHFNPVVSDSMEKEAYSYHCTLEQEIRVETAPGTRPVTFCLPPKHILHSFKELQEQEHHHHSEWAWDAACIWIMDDAGSVYSICPVIPAHSPYPKLWVEALFESCSDGDGSGRVVRWLEGVFGCDGDGESDREVKNGYIFSKAKSSSSSHGDVKVSQLKSEHNDSMKNMTTPTPTAQSMIVLCCAGSSSHGHGSGLATAIVKAYSNGDIQCYAKVSSVQPVLCYGDSNEGGEGGKEKEKEKAPKLHPMDWLTVCGEGIGSRMTNEDCGEGEGEYEYCQLLHDPSSDCHTIIHHNWGVSILAVKWLDQIFSSSSSSSPSPLPRSLISGVVSDPSARNEAVYRVVGIGCVYMPKKNEYVVVMLFHSHSTRSGRRDRNIIEIAPLPPGPLRMSSGSVSADGERVNGGGGEGEDSEKPESFSSIVSSILSGIEQFPKLIHANGNVVSTESLESMLDSTEQLKWLSVVVQRLKSQYVERLFKLHLESMSRIQLLRSMSSNQEERLGDVAMRLLDYSRSSKDLHNKLVHILEYQSNLSKRAEVLATIVAQRTRVLSSTEREYLGELRTASTTLQQYKSRIGSSSVNVSAILDGNGKSKQEEDGDRSTGSGSTRESVDLDIRTLRAELLEQQNAISKVVKQINEMKL